MVAKKVVENTEIDRLGIKLKFTPEDVHRYIAMNSKSQDITYTGTLKMLRDWRKTQRQSTECLALKTALEESGFVRLADDLFGEGTIQTTSEETVSATPRPSASACGIPQGASAATPEDSTSQASDQVSDERLEILAKRVPNGKYSELSLKFGIEYTEATNILDKHGNNVKKAIRECMSDWKNRTGGSLATLKEILRKAGLGGLIRYVE